MNCPKCNSDLTYPNQELMVCTQCFHEWTPSEEVEEEKDVEQIKIKIKNVIDYYGLTKQHVVNVRRDDLVEQVTANVILDYYKFICDYTQPANSDQSRFDLVKFLKAFESIRQNSILDHVPRYKEFLQSFGY